VSAAHFSGTIDEPALYSTALTAGQVAGHHATGSPIATGSSDPMIAAGDIACDPASPRYNGGAGTSTECRQRAVSDLLVGRGLAGVLTLGEHQYEDDAYAKYMQVFDPTWGRVKSLIHPVIGNHEYLTAGAAGYFDYFNGMGRQTGAAGDRSKAYYYSYDIGTWHIVALNSNCSKGRGLRRRYGAESLATR
jgi:acid phosphatase type 7